MSEADKIKALIYAIVHSYADGWVVVPYESIYKYGFIPYSNSLLEFVKKNGEAFGLFNITAEGRSVCYMGKVISFDRVGIL